MKSLRNHININCPATTTTHGDDKRTTAATSHHRLRGDGRRKRGWRAQKQEERPHLLPSAIRTTQVHTQLLQEGHRRLVEQQCAQFGRLHTPHDGGLAAQLAQTHHKQRGLLRAELVSARHRRSAALHISGALTIVTTPRKRPHRCHLVRATQEERASDPGSPRLVAHRVQRALSQPERSGRLHTE